MPNAASFGFKPTDVGGLPNCRARGGDVYLILETLVIDDHPRIGRKQGISEGGSWGERGRGEDPPHGRREAGVRPALPVGRLLREP